MNVERNEYSADWKNDVLERGKTATFLTRYLNSLYGDPDSDSIYSNSFVLCLDADWGFGKTFLIERWAEDLKEKLNHPVVYFDSWKNDFSDDPLLAFLCEFEKSLKAYESITPKGMKILNGVIKVGKSAIAPTNLTSLMKVALKAFTGVDASQSLDAISEVMGNTIDRYMGEAVESHNLRKAKIDDFSKKLESLLNELDRIGLSLPMYVFIDELDRCKPSYAIQLLEGIKHIFGTRGVYFIIATNKPQLSHSIKAVYGGEFDSDTYLQRFFDQEYRLDTPNYSSFARMLIKKYRLDNVNIEKLLMNYDFESTFSILAKGFSLSLRAQEQAAKQLKAIVLTCDADALIHHWYLIFLIMLKIKKEAVFNQTHDSQFLENFRLVFDIQLTLNMRIEVNDHQQGLSHATWGEKPLMNIINLYRKYEKNKPESIGRYFRGSTEGRLLESLSDYGHFDQNPKNELVIKNYKRMVLQAGGLF